MTAAEILALARAYGAAKGLALSGVGYLACRTPERPNGNVKLFPRLAEGRGCNSVSIDRAAAWFVENWPSEVPWPAEVPRPRRRRCAA
jgi:hypothetical protein